MYIQEELLVELSLLREVLKDHTSLKKREINRMGFTQLYHELGNLPQEVIDTYLLRLKEELNKL